MKLIWRICHVNWMSQHRLHKVSLFGDFFVEKYSCSTSIYCNITCNSKSRKVLQTFYWVFIGNVAQYLPTGGADG